MGVQNALAPRCEAVFEAQSDGCRPGRCCPDAIAAVSVALNNRAGGRHLSILDADLQGAFDHISQDFIRARIGSMPGRELLTQGLHAGYGAYGTLHHMTAGTPHGGVASPRLAHIALDGRTKRLGKGDRVVRYADGTPVQAWNIWGASPLTAIVHTEVEQEVECMECFIG